MELSGDLRLEMIKMGLGELAKRMVYLEVGPQHAFHFSVMIGDITYQIRVENRGVVAEEEQAMQEKPASFRKRIIKK